MNNRKNTLRSEWKSECFNNLNIKEIIKNCDNLKMNVLIKEVKKLINHDFSLWIEKSWLLNNWLIDR